MAEKQVDYERPMVAGSSPAGCWGFSLSILHVLELRSLCLEQVSRRGAAIEIENALLGRIMHDWENNNCPIPIILHCFRKQKCF